MYVCACVLFVRVCECVSVCVSVQVLMSVSAFRSQSRTLGVCQDISLTEACLFGVGWPVSAQILLYLPALQSHAEYLPFYVSAGNWSSGSHACRASAPVHRSSSPAPGVAFTFE